MNDSVATPRLRVNVLANFIGRISSALLAVLCTPLYIHFLGVEAYGLIGFYITLQASLSFLEMGLSRTCNRELARYSGQGHSANQSMLDTLRSLEVVYWIVALVLAVLLTLASPWIATSWLKSDLYSSTELEQIVKIMVWVIAMRWPIGVYTGALMGMQQHVVMNVLQFGISVLTWIGAIAVLWLLSPDILTFFQWQFLVALVAMPLYVYIAWRVMPGQFIGGRFSFAVIRKNIPFAASVGGNAVLGTALLQADKLILSAMLPLKQFGYYALASIIASMISTLAGPVSNAVFPRFSQLIGSEASASSIATLYHQVTQALSALIIPFALVLAFFSGEFLFAYTGSVDITENVAMVLMILVIAKMLHASVMVPFALQLSYGWVRLSIWMNLISVIWLVPAVYWLASNYGPIGAAMAWLVVPIFYIAVGMPLMHRRLLVGEWKRWMLHSVIFPVAAITFFLFVFRWIVDIPSGRWVQGLVLLFIGIVSVGIGLLLVRDVRTRIVGWTKNWRDA